MASQRVPLPIVGPSNKATSPAQQTGRTLNLYPEVSDPDAKAVIALHHVPGSFRWRNLGSDFGDISGRNVRGMHTMGDRAFVVSGNRLVELYPQNAVAALATLNTHEGFVGMSDNDGKLILGDGAGFYIFDFDTYALTPVKTATGNELLRGYYSAKLNSQTLYFIRDSDRYYYSDVADPANVDDLWFVTEEGSSDITVAAFVSNQEIIICGRESTGWHYNPGDADNPFRRIDGGFTEHGTVGRRAACCFDNTVCIVGRNKEGQGIVWRLGSAGSAPQRISTHAVEKCIEKVLKAYEDVSDRITMFGYQDAGHSFLFVNLPAVPETVNNPAQDSMTWVYDANTQMWHERGFMNPDTGRFERVLGDHHIAWRGQHFTGAYNAPHVYEQRLDYYRENTLPLVKLRESAGPFNMMGRRFRVLKVGIEMEVGVGRDAGVQGSDPQIIFRYSWDCGQTWSNEILRSIGAIGSGKTEVTIGPCGAGRDFNVQIICSEPVRFALVGGWADVEPV